MAGSDRGEALSLLASQLLAQEAWSNAVQEVSGSGLVAVDGEGAIRWINEVGSELAGRSTDDCVGLPVRELIPPFPERVEADSSPFPAWIAGPERTVIPIELAVVKVTRGEQPLLLGGFHGIAGLLETEQQLRESEGRFDALVRGAPDGLVVVAGGEIIFANPAICEILGFADTSHVVGRPLEQIVASASTTQIIRSVQQAYRGATTRDVELALVRHGGGERWVDAVWVRIEFEGGPAVLGILRDATELRQMRVQMAQTDRLANLGLLAAGLAHEVNNPLSYVLLHLDRLVEELGGAGVDRPDLQQVARQALDGAERIEKIARGLTTFARVDAGDIGPVDVARVIEDAARIAGPEVSRRAQLDLHLADLPPVRAAAGSLAQVFLNLLINAAHAIEPGNPSDHRIEVTAQVDVGEVAVTVTDTGCGIEPEVLGRLFEPFFTTKPPGVGSGLGLSICQRIIEDVGGRIDVESTPGTGTSFTVSLLRAEGRPYSSRWRVPVPAVPGAPPTGRLLLVDDDPAVLDALARVVRIGGHEVVAVESGAEALLRIDEDGPFDLVLTDLMMEGLSGIDLYEKLRQTEPELAERLVFITGGAYSPEVRSFLADVANDRLGKPVDAGSLLEFIAGRLGAMAGSEE